MTVQYSKVSTGFRLQHLAASYAKHDLEDIDQLPAPVQIMERRRVTAGLHS